MQAFCGQPADYANEDAGCLCRPSYRFEGIRLEHSTLAFCSLGQAAYLIVWLQTQRRGAVKEKFQRTSTLFVLPIYARFLTFQAWTCTIWGLFYLCQSYFDQSQQDLPRLGTMILQLARCVRVSAHARGPHSGGRLSMPKEPISMEWSPWNPERSPSPARAPAHKQVCQRIHVGVLCRRRVPLPLLYVGGHRVPAHGGLSRRAMGATPNTGLRIGVGPMGKVFDAARWLARPASLGRRVGAVLDAHGPHGARVRASARVALA